jgi:hypothetical protein
MLTTFAVLFIIYCKHLKQLEIVTSYELRQHDDIKQQNHQTFITYKYNCQLSIININDLAN